MCEIIEFVGINIVLPLLIAVLTYLFIDRLGEWRRRRNYSKLGVAIIETLQDEIVKGIDVMLLALKNARSSINGNELVPPLLVSLPNECWYGMQTISDDILLRIIVTSEGNKFTRFLPKECRKECKNYFRYMNKNYKIEILRSNDLYNNNQDWRPDFIRFLTRREHNYIECAEYVRIMLEEAKVLLEKNSKKLFFTK